jgi:ADP-ribose diphosphatase
MNYVPRPPHGQPVAHDPYFTLMADADGIGFVRCGDGVLVVALTEDDHVLLAVERAVAFGRDELMVVGGGVEPDEPLDVTANRELQEELGWRAGRIDFLGEIQPFKYLTTRLFVFLARDLSASKLPGDELHTIGSYAAPLANMEQLCLSGTLRDATSIAALILARAFLQSGETLPQQALSRSDL